MRYVVSQATDGMRLMANEQRKDHGNDGSFERVQERVIVPLRLCLNVEWLCMEVGDRGVY